MSNAKAPSTKRATPVAANVRQRPTDAGRSRAPSKPDPLMHRAYADVAQGQEDTDCRNSSDEVINSTRRKPQSSGRVRSRQH